MPRAALLRNADDWRSLLALATGLRRAAYLFRALLLQTPLYCGSFRVVVTAPFNFRRHY